MYDDRRAELLLALEYSRLELLRGAGLSAVVERLQARIGDLRIESVIPPRSESVVIDSDCQAGQLRDK